MTTIQIITAEMEDKYIRIMIEELIENQLYRGYYSFKNKNMNSKSYYSAFELLDKDFTSASDTLGFFMRHKNILSVSNEISSLLTSEQIKQITNCENLKES
ncbi:hypothetical protein CP985_13450 [Malaciobacter mytili LMG 24559]|uniref:Uncharacterized protein n=1 Tax=Malaciobacter mytili LMG 24559 TaxID=1032238 RepID=A0AAX2AE09_9BACT|nr:hypothetical protein [Malaciobacter mytili]AXH16490.1 hypothetical protein AMYT_a0192 [Malaciobacter mytili LMG 24559]RXK12995.1 hypothetical protein CP985_13450 [Malaciobacter mytili LMG 24559]